MDKRLQLIAHLYDEEIEGLEPLGSLLADPELREEYEALSETRFRLERRERIHPDRQLIDLVVATAARDVRPGARTERPPLRLVRTRRLWLPAMTLAASLLVVVLVRPWDSGTETMLEKSGPAEPALAAAPAESLLGTLPPAPAPVITASTAETIESDPETDWETGEDLRLISRRIAALGEAGIDAWDGPAIPLEFMPDDGTDLLTPAGATRTRF